MGAGEIPREATELPLLFVLHDVSPLPAPPAPVM